MPLAPSTVIHNWVIAVARPGTGSAGTVAERERARLADAQRAARERHWQALIGKAKAARPLDGC